MSYYQLGRPQCLPLMFPKKESWIRRVYECLKVGKTTYLLHVDCGEQYSHLYTCSLKDYQGSQDKTIGLQRVQLPHLKEQIISLHSISLPKNHSNTHQDSDDYFIVVTSKALYHSHLSMEQSTPNMVVDECLLADFQHNFNPQIFIKSNKIVFSDRSSNLTLRIVIFEHLQAKIKLQFQHSVPLNYNQLLSCSYPSILGFSPHLSKLNTLTLNKFTIYQTQKDIRQQQYSLACIVKNISVSQIVQIDSSKGTYCVILGNFMDRNEIFAWIYDLNLGYTVNLLQFSGVFIKLLRISEYSGQIELLQQVGEEEKVFSTYRREVKPIGLRRFNFMESASSSQLELIEKADQIICAEENGILSISYETQTLISRRKIHKKQVYLRLIEEINQTSNQTSKQVYLKGLKIQSELIPIVLDLL